MRAARTGGNLGGGENRVLSTKCQWDVVVRVGRLRVSSSRVSRRRVRLFHTERDHSREDDEDERPGEEAAPADPPGCSALRGVVGGGAREEFAHAETL